MKNEEELKKMCICGHDMSCHTHTPTLENPRNCMICDCPYFDDRGVKQS